VAGSAGEGWWIRRGLGGIAGAGSSSIDGGYPRWVGNNTSASSIWRCGRAHRDGDGRRGGAGSLNGRADCIDLRADWINFRADWVDLRARLLGIWGLNWADGGGDGNDGRNDDSGLGRAVGHIFGAAGDRDQAGGIDGLGRQWRRDVVGSGRAVRSRCVGRGSSGVRSWGAVWSRCAIRGRSAVWGRSGVDLGRAVSDLRATASDSHLLGGVDNRFTITAISIVGAGGGICNAGNDSSNSNGGTHFDCGYIT